MPNARRARQIIDQVAYATVSTVSPEGMPWNSPVFTAFDADYTFYWGSHRDAQHSRNIRANGRGFLVVYNSMVPPGQGEGVYIEASCAELVDEAEKRRAHELIRLRRLPIPYWKLEQVLGDTPIHLYRAVPQIVWMNDEGSRDGHYIDTRTEISLTEHRRG
ncbi:MAG TPA: pyridoxamine 5'-phosphate oxidase family protein [Candidatus Saccharimonadia bacterium]|nr:pyridoxamine 5'-phosphate oxidase family protein [Candidatus Saccharimonadia bacterium]